MKLHHPAVRSDLYELVTTLEFDLELGGHFLPTRIELFRDLERPRHWRCRMWERELYHLAMTQPDVRGGRRPSIDEELLVERIWELSNRFEDFEAPSARRALDLFLTSLQGYLERMDRPRASAVP
jgi:hypothetical protein